MRPEQIPHLNFVRDLFGNLWLDVRDSGYLPVLGAETNHDKSTLALIFNPKTFTVSERYDRIVNSNPTFDGSSAVGDHASALANTLLTKVRILELENAQLKSQLNVAEKDSTKERAKRHLERYRLKRQKANNDGDLMAGAAADQRIRALEALLSS